MREKTKEIIYELKNHAPFTVMAAAIAVLSSVLIFYFSIKLVSEESFHFFHFLHVAASAMVTSAIFYKYRPRILFALLVGISGAIFIGTLSDIVFPYLGWILLNLEIEFHLPLLEETLYVLLFALFGALAGTITKITKPPHLLHVFLSVFASLFYLLAFALDFTPLYFIIAFFIVFVAVIIPCCLSDIVFPFFFMRIPKNSHLK